MISIASAMKQEEIITLLEAYQGENETFTFKEKNGIKLFFEVEGDPETAAQVAKQLIKEQPWGSVLYFQATVVKMIRNGLFLCSIGFLIVLYSLNPSSLNYDLLSLTTGIFFIGLGGYLFFKGKKVAEEEATKDEVKR